MNLKCIVFLSQMTYYLQWTTEDMFCIMVDQLNTYISKECNIISIMARVHKSYVIKGRDNQFYVHYSVVVVVQKHGWYLHHTTY